MKRVLLVFVLASSVGACVSTEGRVITKTEPAKAAIAPAPPPTQAAVPQEPFLRNDVCDRPDIIAKYGPTVRFQSIIPHAIVQIVIIDETKPVDNNVICQMTILENPIVGGKPQLGGKLGPDPAFHPNEGWKVQAFATNRENLDSGEVKPVRKPVRVRFLPNYNGMVVDDPTVQGAK